MIEASSKGSDQPGQFAQYSSLGTSNSGFLRSSEPLREKPGFRRLGQSFRLDTA